MFVTYDLQALKVIRLIHDLSTVDSEKHLFASYLTPNNEYGLKVYNFANSSSLRNCDGIL